MKRIFLSLLAFVSLTICAQDLVNYIDSEAITPRNPSSPVSIGVPWGMLHVGPMRQRNVLGFSHTLAEINPGDNQNTVSLMPTYGYVDFDQDRESSPYSHDREICRPGFYGVMLDRYAIKAELTASNRVALHQYTFPKGSRTANIIINLDTAADTDTETRIWVLDDYVVTGYIRNKSHRSQDRYFVIQFSKEMRTYVQDSINGRCCQVFFSVSPEDKVLAKVALSTVSEMGALINMRSEMPSWDFYEVYQGAEGSWNQELSRNAVTLPTQQQTQAYYTNLYITMQKPNPWRDVTGD